MWIYQIKLRNKIFLLCTVLVLFTTVVIQVSTWTASNKYNQQQLVSHVTSAKQVLKSYLSAQEKQLATAAKVLTSDFGFIRAVATSDEQTIKSVLLNHGERINAALMLLIDLNGNLITSSHQENQSSDLGSESIKYLTAHPGQSFFSTINGELYQLILLPVKAPHTIAYSILGFRINVNSINELKKLTGVDVSFYEGDDHLLSSTIRLKRFSDFRNMLNNEVAQWLVIKRPAFITDEMPLSSIASNPIGVMLISSLAPLYKQYDEIVLNNLFLALIVSALASLLSILFARGITTPLSKLSKLAQEYSVGHYQSKIDNKRSSVEAQQLFTAFETMGERIKQREDKILYQAQHDILTGLYNAQTIKEKLIDYLADGNKKILITFSIRNFRQINDRLGPDVADQCLKTLSTRLNSTQVVDVITSARLDGIEFFSLINLTPHISISNQVNVFLTALEGTLTLSNVSLNLDLNAGVVIYPDDGQLSQILLRRASIALDHARKNSSRIHFYTEGEDEKYLERLHIIDALKKTLKINASINQELFMVYQPKIELKQQTIKAEALIRWIHNEKGFISPELFVELAEQTGLIIDLTNWVIDTVFQQMAKWQRGGDSLPVSINVSAQDLTSEQFEANILSRADKYQVDTQHVTLEITEREIMHDEHKVIQSLKNLKSHGFIISIDDYGIGQSSLSKLKDLPVHEIKLDKSFIMPLSESEKDRLIVYSTIQLAHALGFKTVAEGVENKASMDILEEQGCDQIQGYFISKPLKVEDFNQWREKYVEDSFI